MLSLFNQTSAESPVHSHGIFSVDLSAWIGALGVCLTYVIVLVQFRMSEDTPTVAIRSGQE